MEEEMNNATNDISDTDGIELENPEIPQQPASADNYEGLINAKGLAAHRSRQRCQH